ncbi:transient-receptor-potential-like protein isoform X2 [Dendroctonus ponderosae]|nr:transient-receptor-potential-like protein isoform X2 [Dendroctonus ponderosae]XP_048519503.1 transient-receptor-potential-like protein isoform X2 [Dendroctonus ponderosae]
MANNDEDVEAKVGKGISSVPILPKMLSLEEKKYLLAIERGDLPHVRRMLQKVQRKKFFDVNCVDSLGRGALTIAIDQENLELVELLVVMGVETRDALLYAISVEFVEAVELLLEHEELLHKEGELYSWQKVDINTATFTPDITPLVLAAHRNNYEILKILLDRGATISMPHDIKCGCDDCVNQSEEDSLRHSLSRLNEYKALASPSLIALSSSDPLLTAFQLSWELRNLAFAEPESKSEYMDLRKQCQQFAVDLLQQSRSSSELAIILNHDPDNPPYQEGEHMKLARLELAILYKQKKFVAHPNIQQLLAALWYEGVPGFRRKSSPQKLMIIMKVTLLFPFYCLLYTFAPETKSGKLMRKPFMKFLIHASSYLFFLLLLILVSLRADDLFFEHFGSQSMKSSVLEQYQKQRGNPPSILEYAVLIYVLGYIFEETHEIFTEGIQSYLRNLWNFIDFTRNLFYALTFVLRAVAYLQQINEIQKDPTTAFLRREQWHSFDPQLIAEGLFAAANIFSALKLVHLFSINPHLGPLQISLGRMVIDIVKFFFIYTLVLFAFACGLNQLLWYFSDLEKQKCYHLPNGEPDFENAGDACMKWRRFANVFESSQSLFWASFGMIDLDSFELTGIKTYTRFWGLLMFGSYCVINVIVLLNLLIAMMSNSYAMIEEHSDTEWKFARTKLWMSYFEQSGTLPPPFNIFPKPKNIFKLLGIRKKDKLKRMSTKRRNREEKERDYRYTAVMRALVWRYVSAMHRKCDENEVTEDDVNELKSDISSFRYELMELLSKNGMDVSSAERKEKAILGKKMKIWERRLMKDFKVAPVSLDEDEGLFSLPPEGETSLAKFRRIAKMAAQNSSLNKWHQVVRGACIASQIGRCHRRDSFKKQQNLQKAMEEAKQLAVKTPDISRSNSSLALPDYTGEDIVKLIKDEGSPFPEFKNVLRMSPNVKRAEATLFSPNITVIPPQLTSLKPAEGQPSLPLNEVADLIYLESAQNSPAYNAKSTKDNSPSQSVKQLQTQEILKLDSTTATDHTLSENNSQSCIDASHVQPASLSKAQMNEESLEGSTANFASEDSEIKECCEELNKIICQDGDTKADNPNYKEKSPIDDEKDEIFEEALSNLEQSTSAIGLSDGNLKISENKTTMEDSWKISRPTTPQSLNLPSISASRPVSPMAQRNIQRVHMSPASVRQPKYGWL